MYFMVSIMTDPGTDDRIKASYMRAELKRKVLEMKEEGLDVSHMDDILYMEDDDNGLPSSVNIEYLLKNWNVRYDYHISSHRKVIGPALVFGRKLVNGEINRGVLPLFDMQNRLNHMTASALQSHESSIRGLSQRIHEMEAENKSLRHNLTEQRPALPGQALIAQGIIEVNERLDEVIAAMGMDAGSKPFNEASGRTGDIVKEAYSSSIGYFAGRNGVLDIGYGRSDISLLAAGSFTTYEVDVRREDVIAHLGGLEDACLDGAFMGYVIEAMDRGYLSGLVSMLGKKMKPGAPLVIVTTDLAGLEDAYSDRLEALLRPAGFDVLEIKWYRPAIPENVRIQKVLVDSPSYNARDAIDRLNDTIDKFNERLYGGRDLLIAARRSA